MQNVPEPRQLLLGLIPLFLLYAIVASFAWPWLRRCLSASVHQSPETELASRWSLWEVLLTGLFVVFIWDLIILFVLLWAGGPGDLYPQSHLELIRNPEAMDQMEATINGTGGTALGSQWKQEVKLTQGRFLLWVQVIGLPLKLLSLFILLQLISGTRPSDVGFHSGGFLSNLQLGVAGWLVFSPLVLTLFGLVNYAYRLWIPEGASEHLLTELFPGSRPIEKILLVGTAVVSAPLVEEIFFRGVVQGWAKEDERYSWGLIGITLALACLSRVSQIGSLFRSLDWRLWVDALGPVVFVILVGVVLLLLQEKLSREWKSIVATSLLWAMIHVDAWPSPVGLLLLGIVLGWLMQRTGSLVAPIVLHALFNCIACVSLFLQ